MSTAPSRPPREAGPSPRPGGSDLRWHVVSHEERERLRDAAAAIFPRHPWVRVAWLHGSTAEAGRAGRDVDIGLLARPMPPSWREEARLAEELAAAVGIRDVPFDVRVVNGASPVFLNSMLRSGVRLYEADQAERVRFEATAMAQWLDFRPVWDRMRRAALERWTRG